MAATTPPTRFPKSRRPISRSRAACCSPTGRSTSTVHEGAAARRPRRTCSTSDGRARRHRPVLVRLLLREHQPGRVLAGHARARDQRQRPDVHRRQPDQPDSERPADPAGGHRARASRASSGRTSARSTSRTAQARVLHALGNGRAARLRRTAGSPPSPTSVRAAPTCRSSARSTTSRCSSCPRRASATPPTRRILRQTCPTRSPACCRAARSTARRSQR